MHVLMTYLAPSVLGMNSDGFGGSLWHRGTLTGRGLFRGARNKIFSRHIQKEVPDSVVATKLQALFLYVEVDKTIISLGCLLYEINI